MRRAPRRRHARVCTRTLPQMSATFFSSPATFASMTLDESVTFLPNVVEAVETMVSMSFT